MMLRLPSGLKQTFIYGISIALMKGVSLLMLPFIAHHLSTEEFGRLEVISTLAIIGSILVGMGLEDTLFRFAGAARDPQQQRRLAAEIFTLTLIIGSIAITGGWLMAELIASWIPGKPTVYEVQLVLSMLALEGCIAIPLGWLRMRNRAISFFLATTGRATTQALIVVVQLSFDRGVAGILEAALIAAVIQVIVLGYLHIRDTGIGLTRNTGVQSFIYSLPIVGSGLVAFALNGLDRWVLAEHTSLTDVAQFGVAAKFALAVVLLMQPFTMWWSPRRFAVLNEKNGREKVVRFISLGVVLILIVSVLTSIISPLLITWLLPDSYAMAGQYVLGLVLIMLLREMVELFKLGCFTGKTTSAQLIINTIASAVGIAAMLLWAPVYAVWGVIFALILAQALRLLLFFIAGQYFLPLPFDLRSLSLISGITIFWIGVGTQISITWQTLLIMLIAVISLIATALLCKLVSIPALTSTKVLSS